MREYFVVSVVHTHRSHKYITFWRPEDKGYAWPLPWSGRYSEEYLLSKLQFYNDGWHSIAVPVDVVERLGVTPAKGQIDGDIGPVVLNTRENWKLLEEAAIRPPLNKVKLYINK